MTQQEFNILSKKYLDGVATAQEEAELLQWYETQPEANLPASLESDSNDLQRRMWHAIRIKAFPFYLTWYSKRPWVVGIAASIVLLCGWVILFSKKGPESLKPMVAQYENTGFEIKNNNQTGQEVKLEDGSRILLSPQSSLVYGKNFNKVKREVFLSGEAFFEIKRDETKPFVVHSGELNTEVLGTSFGIKNDILKGTVEVAVATGKVSVYANTVTDKMGRDGVVLTPNQKVLYDVSSKIIVKGIVEAPKRINTTEENPLIFKSESLTDVLQVLSNVYGIEFIISNPKIRHCSITADLDGLAMYTQLELICKSIDAKYEKRGTEIFIYGEGCE